VLNRIYILLLVLVGITPLWAQEDEPIKMTPELALTMPLTNVGEEVMVKYPVMISPTAIMKPGMVWRTLYILTNGSEGTSDLALAHHGNMEQAFSRSTSSSDSDQQKMPPELAHELEGYRRTVWPVIVNFQLAMAQLPTYRLHLIYSIVHPDKTRELVDERFSFSDGLFIGLPDGKVTVLAVEKGSKADESGVKAGDQIVAVGGIAVPGDLSAYSSTYSAAKRAAKDNEASTFPITLRSTGASESHTVNIAMPLRIKSSLMDGGI
jgi:hypothetical protein